MPSTGLPAAREPRPPGREGGVSAESQKINIQSNHPSLPQSLPSTLPAFGQGIIARPSLPLARFETRRVTDFPALCRAHPNPESGWEGW
ncbi:hypothetical protein MCOR29_001724 [Pyricularia oryzae]|nr:hypothetical protein MCOR30_010449 [Pyricularia oryzae]KAI6330780.1 hypothetical protein MCOR29_001724 [Pyricularia oryzae]KAI6389286.1 hypothetical protein MCOR23_010252 [Pyricularia oryzae]KAI6429128.1 hypothetical protein MCOR22_010367 [Pyricularia oryzae]KAI6519528.1 hypothetical protein MCOR05_011066 [Pyricularia oryzae]